MRAAHGRANQPPADAPQVLGVLRRVGQLAETCGPTGPTQAALTATATDIAALVPAVSVRLVCGRAEEGRDWSLRLYLAGELLVEHLAGGWSRAPEPPPPSMRITALGSDSAPAPPGPRVVSRLTARSQAVVRATRRPLTANVLAGLLAQEPALAGATVERGTYGEMVIDLAGGEAWATLDGAGRPEWVAADVPDPETPPHDSVAFAQGRQQFKVGVALLARSKRRVLDGPVRCKGARPRAVRFKPRSGARRAARRGATRAGPGEDGASEPAPGDAGSSLALPLAAGGAL